MDIRLMVTIIFLSTSVVRCTQIECSTEKRCKCRKSQLQKGNLFAICENLSLTRAPAFRADVSEISLAQNNISEFPCCLPKTITYLNLSRNLLHVLNRTSLSSYPNLRNVDISNNKLEEIQLNAFGNCSKLEFLNISNNRQLTIEVILNISYDLQYSRSIRNLDFEYLQCTYGDSQTVKKRHLFHLRDTLLEVLSLASNRIHELERGVFLNLPKSLKVLNLNNNVLSIGFYILEFGNMPNLEIFHVSFQSTFHQTELYEIFFKCNDTKINPRTRAWDSLPQFQLASKDHSHFYKRNMLGDSVHKNVTFYLPRKLKQFHFHDNLYKMAFPALTVNGASHLTHAYFQNSIIYRLEGPMYGSGNIQYADLSNNFCNHISPSFFVDFQNLSYLDLSRNALGSNLEHDVNGKIFHKLYSLTSLNLAHNRLVTLPEKLFRNLNQIQTLNLSYNSLGEFKVYMRHMERLQLLDFSYNQLSEIDVHTREALNTVAKRGKLQINLIGNHLRCTCENLGFLSWIQKSRSIEFLNLGNYTCSFENSSKIQIRNIDFLLQQMEKNCASYTSVIVLASLSVVAALTICVSRVIYRYRWKLRYMYYVAREKYQRDGHQKERSGKTFRFDAFVSYADEDTVFLKSLANRLEKEYGLRLCIHHRDFIPGTGIADNITNAIHNSHRTVCLITSHFLESYWCMFELNMARMEAIYSRDGCNVLLLIVLDKNVVKKMPMSIIDLIESMSYLEYPACGDEDEKTAFCSKLEETLKFY
ncbi:toll-like receptor 4 [Ostrea edulis]|uniref:toll-like receptor 4 n=1 Tax=Ostrea edulis TaxID=37623 RepID=UPI0024AF7A14|nr:toll-like receptor 4 [Ostrea edulis]